MEPGRRRAAVRALTQHRRHARPRGDRRPVDPGLLAHGAEPHLALVGEHGDYRLHGVSSDWSDFLDLAMHPDIIDLVEDVLGPGPLVVAFGDSLIGEFQLPANEVAPDTVLDAPKAWVYDGTVDGILEANTLALDDLKRGRVGVDHSRAAAPESWPKG